MFRAAMTQRSIRRTPWLDRGKSHDQRASNMVVPAATAATSDEDGPRASIIVCNYNGYRFLENCLRTLTSQHLEGGFEVIVVDNHSTDGSADYVRVSWPGVRLLESDRNLGFAGGNNLGIRHARGQYIALLNNDTKVRAGWLEALVRSADEDRAVGAVTSKIVYMDRPNTIQNAGSLLLSDGSGADRGAGEINAGQYDCREEVFAACGCAVLYRRDALRDVGLFDEAFFCYYEDTDLSWRLRLRGWKIVYEPRAVVEHVHAATSVEWSPFFIFHAERNRVFMIIKNAPLGFVVKSCIKLGQVSIDYALKAVWRRLGRGRGGGSAAGGSSRARIHLRVLISIVEHLPRLVVQRGRIRTRRTVSDREIRRWFVPKEEWDQRFAG